MCTVLLPPGVNSIAVKNKLIIIIIIITWAGIVLRCVGEENSHEDFIG
jgi:hypothetical protein